MAAPNFSSLAGLEVDEKFVRGWWNTWLLCLTPTLVALELSWVGFWQYLLYAGKLRKCYNATVLISFSFWSYLLVMGGCGYCILVIVVLLLFCCYFITYDKTFMFYQGYITFQTLSGSVKNFFFESKSDNNLRSLLWKSVLNMSLCSSVSILFWNEWHW